MDEELLLISKTEKVVSLFWWRCCEDYWNDKGFRILNLIDKAVTRFERTDYTFEESYAVGKMLPNSISCYREISPKIDVATFIVLALKIATTTSTFNNRHPNHSADIDKNFHQQNDYALLKAEMMASIF